MVNEQGTSVTWLGSIADTATALRASGALDGGGRVIFDIPENQIVAYAGLLLMRGQQLRITVEAVGWQGGDDGRP